MNAVATLPRPRAVGHRQQRTRVAAPEQEAGDVAAHGRVRESHRDVDGILGNAPGFDHRDVALAQPLARFRVGDDAGEDDGVRAPRQRGVDQRAHPGIVRAGEPEHHDVAVERELRAHGLDGVVEDRLRDLGHQHRHQAAAVRGQASGDQVRHDSPLPRWPRGCARRWPGRRRPGCCSSARPWPWRLPRDWPHRRASGSGAWLGSLALVQHSRVRNESGASACILMQLPILAGMTQDFRPAGARGLRQSARRLRAPAPRVPGGAQRRLGWLLGADEARGCRPRRHRQRPVHHLEAERGAQGRIHRTPAAAAPRSARAHALPPRALAAAVAADASRASSR